MDWPAPVCVEEGAIKEVRGFEATSFVDLKLRKSRRNSILLRSGLNPG